MMTKKKVVPAPGGYTFFSNNFKIIIRTIHTVIIIYIYM